MVSRTKLASLIITLCFGSTSFLLSFRLLQSSPDGAWELNKIYEYIPIQQPCQSLEHNITEQDVQNLFHLWNAALHKSPKVVAERYTQDAVLLGTVSDAPRTNQEEIENYFENFLKMKPNCTIIESTIRIGKDWCEDVGIYQFDLLRNGTKDIVKARYTFIYVYQNGEWKIQHHHSSFMPESNNLRQDNNVPTPQQQLLQSETMNVTIVMTKARRDRLGSNVGRPFNLMAYAQCKGYNFCVLEGRIGLGDVFHFPICPSDIYNTQPTIGNMFEVNITQSGIYNFHGNDNAMFQELGKTDIHCLLNPQLRQRWRKMILSADSYQDEKSIASQYLFQNENATKIVVHIRRGDVPKKRKAFFVKDETYVEAIRKLRNMLIQKGRVPEVHIFSEEHGDTNWTAYDNLADYIHLAPQMNQIDEQKSDMELNLRDWRHFIQADVLIAGPGMYSRMASYARDDPDEVTGLPLTLSPCRLGRNECNSRMQRDFSEMYIAYDASNPSHLEFLNLPSAWDENTTKENRTEVVSNLTESSLYVLPYMDSQTEREYIQRIQYTYMKQKDNQTERRYISMSLYGNDTKYVDGAIENLKLQPTYFPGWTIRIYASPSYPAELMDKLKSYGAEVVHPPSFLVNGTFYAMFWRFLIHDDPNVDRWISRDSDSRLNARDYFAVEEWIESGKGSHTVRDHPNHYIFVNGGLWGSTKGSLFSNGNSNMTNAIQSFLGKCNKEWGCDNWFLQEEIWPLMKNDQLGHDAFRCDKKPNSIGFPTPRDKNGQFVGQVFSVPDNQPRMKETRPILEDPVKPQCDRHQKEEKSLE